jgi:hypothetical protein
VSKLKKQEFIMANFKIYSTRANTTSQWRRFIYYGGCELLKAAVFYRLITIKSSVVSLKNGFLVSLKATILDWINKRSPYAVFYDYKQKKSRNTRSRVCKVL